MGQPIPGKPSVKGDLPPALADIGIDQRLNEQVPLDLKFKDEQGRTVTLGDYFHPGRPVIVSLVYYNCPMLCGEVMNGMAAAFKTLKFTPGKEYEVVTLSIDPREKPALAAAKKKAYIERLGRPEAAAGWHFLTGEKPQIDALADAIGWHYHYDAKLDQFAHAAGIVLVTPQGQDLAVLLRHGVLGPRHAPGNHRGFAEQDRHRWPTRCCCTATTTIRARASTAR